MWGNRVKSNRNHSTNFVKIQHRADIYKLAIKKFKETNPKLNPINYLADMLFISPDKLYLILENQRTFTIKEEENFLELTNFKQEFSELIGKYLSNKHKEMQNEMDFKKNS